MLPARILAPAIAVLLAAVGCTASGSGRPAGLPAGEELLTAAAAAMREVKTVRFRIEADGDAVDVPVRRADGRLTREGSADGSVRIDQGSGPTELRFVVIGSQLWVKGPTDGWQRLPLGLASSVYDPSAILNPDRGVAKLLDDAQDARTEARESVDGVDAYRVAARFDSQAMAALVPGAADGTTGQVWIDTGTKRPVRMRLTLPAAAGRQPGAVTVRFTEYDAPVTINAP